MNAFRDDLRDLVSKHIAQLPVERIVTLLDSAASKPRASNGKVLAPPIPFAKLNALGESQEDDCQDWAAVLDVRTGLEWTREPIGGKRLTWSEAKKAASEVRLCERRDWRLPTIHELLTLVDYERCDPAINTDYFNCPAEWFWSSTEAKSPSGYAWSVGFSDGVSLRYGQDGNGWCRAVRAGQQLGFGI